MVKNTADKGTEAMSGPEQRVIAVSQPQKLESLLETIDLINTVSERIGEDRSGDLGASGTSGQTGDDDSAQSLRDQAIATLPDSPVMKKRLAKHIEQEVLQLRREIRRTTRRLSHPGAAHHLNDLYKRIRRLQGLLNELYRSSVEVIQRLYIRIFIDKQPVLSN